MSDDFPLFQTDRLVFGKGSMDRRSFLLGAGATILVTQAAGAQVAGQTAPIVLADKVTAAQKLVPEGTSHVVTNAYDVSRHATRGRARYRLSDTDAVSGLPGEAWFVSANNRYFVLDENPISPLMLGAEGDGTHDDTAAVQATRDFCAAERVPMLVDTYFAHSGTLELTAPITLRGIGRENCGLYLFVDREHEGVNILASGVSITDIEIRAHIPKTIQNGQGSYGTCITVGKIFYDPEYDNGKFVDPALVLGTDLARLKLTRAEGSGAGHAIACVGRVSGIRGQDIIFEGLSARHSHATAVLVHWGTSGEDFPRDAEGTTLKPLVLPKTAEATTYHPNNIRFDGLRIRNTGRLAAISSAYAVRISDVDFDGLDDGVSGNGTQLLDLMVGDEADRFAHPDDKGKIYSNISLTGIVAYNITGVGTNARAVVDCTGVGHSKYEDDPNTGRRYQAQPLWKNVELADILVEADLSDTTELINVRNFLGDITFRNVHATGKISQGGMILWQCQGKQRFDNCTINGRTLIDDCDGVAMRDCRLAGSMLPALMLDVGSSNGFSPGEAVKGSASAVRGVVAAIPDESTVQVQLLDDWTPFTEGEDLMGTVARPIRAVSTANNATLMIRGEALTAALQADLTAGKTEIAVTGFPDPVKIGDKITYDGGILYAQRYAPANAGRIETTPAPTDIPAGTELTLDRRSQNVRFTGCDISGSGRAVSAVACRGVVFEGGSIRDSGQYGLWIGDNAEVDVIGTTFSNNGLRRLLPHDANLATRDVAVAGTGLFNGRLIRFEDSAHVQYNVKVDPGALGGSLQNSIFAGAPIEASLSIARVQKNGRRFVVAGNTDATGRE